jgi:phospholipid-transporting ATPase
MDSELNSRIGKVLSPDGSKFIEKQWKNIKVGDIVRLESNEFFPADLILLCSSEPEGLCYIETSNLDGETNLKIKQANPNTSGFMSPQEVGKMNGYLRSEQPNNSLYTYEGTLVMKTNSMTEKEIPLDPGQLLLRGAQLRSEQRFFMTDE